MAETRIVSLIASATEIVAALGFGRCLVGRSHECDYPPELLDRSICSAAKIDVDANSREIDARVRSLAGDAISVYRVDADLLARLRPTHVLTQSQCEVCAVSLKDVEEAVGRMAGCYPKVVALSPMCLEDVWTDILSVGRALDAEGRAAELVASLRRQLGEISACSARAPVRPKIACIEWIDPLMAAGNWVPELVTLAGGTNVVGIPGRHSPWLDWEELAARDPDAIAVMPCGFGLARTEAEMAVLEENARWRDLRAVRTGNVFLTDGNQFFNRPGPRLVESARILAEILHPELFESALAGTGWLRFEPTGTGRRHAAESGSTAATSTGWMDPRRLG